MSRTEFAWRAAIVLAMAAALFFLWQLGSVLMLTFGGIVFAVVIRLAADPIARLLKMEGRWATLLVLLIILAFFAGGAYLFGNIVVEQFGQLQQRLPEGWERIRDRIGGEVEEASSSEDGGGLPLADLMSAASTTYGFFVDLILVLLVAVYLAFNPWVYRRGLLSRIPAARRDAVAEALDTGRRPGGCAAS